MSIADISGISNLKYQQCIKRYSNDNVLLPKTLALKFNMGKKNLFLFCVFQISFQSKSCRSNFISGFCDCTFWIISYKKNLKGENCSPQNDCIFLLVTSVTHKNHGYT